MTTSQQTYDPYRLIDEVTSLLRSRGLSPHVERGQAGAAVGGAGMLLRALGIDPMMDAVTAFELSADREWSERDDHRGSQSSSS